MKQTADPPPKKKDNCYKEPRGINNNKNHSNWIDLGKTLEKPSKYENEKDLFGNKWTAENDVLLKEHAHTTSSIIQLLFRVHSADPTN
jgi:hypothetical protein